MRHVLAFVLLVPAAAHADDAPPPAAPGFVTLDRGDATSRLGIEASYELSNNSVATDGASDTAMRFEAHGQYVDPELHVGGYAMIPIAYLNESDQGASQSATGIDDAELGAIYVPRVSDNLGLVLRAGVALPTGSTSDNGVAANIIGSVSRLSDFYLSIPKGTSLRLAVSPLWRAGMIFARADVGIDINLDGADAMTADKIVRLNAAVGFDLGQFSLSLESVNIYDIPRDGELTDSSFGSQWIDEGAIAGRFRSGIYEPYAAVVFPLDHDSYQFIDASLTVGLDVRLR
ncbi:MAG TPA: hypothetical protein VH143_28935 [Kofleriaceae bacterium]|jgi:hypothetical protein|nr:hypothetical protein [Kofleriaceae bacterium]